MIGTSTGEPEDFRNALVVNSHQLTIWYEVYSMWYIHTN